MCVFCEDVAYREASKASKTFKDATSFFIVQTYAGNVTKTMRTIKLKKKEKNIREVNVIIK